MSLIYSINMHAAAFVNNGNYLTMGCLQQNDVPLQSMCYKQANLFPVLLAI